MPSRMPSVRTWTQAIIDALDQAHDPEHAEAMARYMKTERVVHGVSMPTLDGILASQLSAAPLDPDERLEAAAAMWETGLWTMRQASGRLARRSLTPWKRRADLVPRILDQCEAWLEAAEGWAEGDQIAVQIAGPLLAFDPADRRLRLTRWSRAESCWLRRAALSAQIKPAQKGQADLILLAEIAERLCTERDWFMRKALGTTLREVAKHEPGWVRLWVEDHPDLSALTRNEALRHIAD